MTFRLLDLFSGIGGFSLAARMAGGYETVAFCEIDPFCRTVLAKHWPGVTIHDDITKIDPAALPDADIWTGGFPCQDISCAGKGAGLHGSRSGMFFEIVRLLHGVRRRPDWLLLENVPAILGRGLDRVLDELAGAGYTCWPVVMGAWSVGAPHKRDRVWIVGKLDHANGQRTECLGHVQRRPGAATTAHPLSCGPSEKPTLANPQLDARREQEPGREEDQGTPAGGTGQGGGSDFATDDDWLDNILSLGGTVPIEAELQAYKPMADAPRGRLGADRGARDAGHADERSETLADAERTELGRGTRQEPQAQRRGNRPAIDGYRWPSRPGEPQFDWEPPRLLTRGLELGVGSVPSGLPARLVRCANKDALKAYGNSIVPQVAAEILRWIGTQT